MLLRATGDCPGASEFLVPHAYGQVIYPFIDVVTREKFVFISGKASSSAAQEVLVQNFAMEDLEEVGKLHATCISYSMLPPALVRYPARNWQRLFP